MLKQFAFCVLILPCAVLAGDSPAGELRVGMIGLDTSHVVAFTRILNTPEDKDHVPGARVVAAFKGGSPDVENSRTRIDAFTDELVNRFGVRLYDTMEELAENVDAIMIESVDGRAHLEQARRVFPFRKPVFIDKPLAGSLKDGIEIVRLGRLYGTPFFSSSPLRYLSGIEKVKSAGIGRQLGAFSMGPARLEPHHPDLFWYGIHAVEAMYTVMGPGCATVVRTHTADTDIVTGVWSDGRVGTVRGVRNAKSEFALLVFGTEGTIGHTERGSYPALLKEVVTFFRTGATPVDPLETIEILAFMEAADESKRRGGTPVSIAETMKAAGATAEMLRVANGVVNGGFESGATIDDAGWTVRSNDDLLSAGFSTEAKEGRRSLKVEYPAVQPRAYHDWFLENSGRQDVQPGEVWTASAWVKYRDTERVGIEIMALSGGEPLDNWTSGYGAAYGSGDWTLLEATALIPPGCDQIYVRLTGSGGGTAWVDGVHLRKGEAQGARRSKPETRGWAFNGRRIEETLNRGVVAMPVAEDVVYVQWRLMKSDSPDVAFNVYRATAGGEAVRLNGRPISATTDFRDESVRRDDENVYFVRPVTGGLEGASSEQFTVPADAAVKPYLTIKLDRPDTTAQRVGIGDLNGDGRHDFVILTPNTNVDPFHNNWRPSETTFQLEAYLSDGTFLWRKDLGWNIEAGVWYSPYLVYDFDGDGRAEVAVKIGPEGDLRDPAPSQHGLYRSGRVTDGPEYVAILDGMTGEEKARADWPSRIGLGSYNHYSRNLMVVAYLDGKTPCLVTARGTYTVNKLDAWQFHGGRLDRLWAWDSTKEPGGRAYGQGGHTMHTADVTGDGRDEIVLGAAVVGSNGQGLWSVNLGHPDNVWVGNIDPTRPGMEIYMGIEGARVKGSVQNGVCLVDARTGEILWGLKERTYHVHGRGLVSNIDPRHAGMECYSGEQAYPARWLHTARGELIANERTFNVGLSPAAVYWDATPERELLVGSRLFKFPDETIADYVEGRQVAWVDLLGDWREEIITSVPGELRIYVTPIPAADRRVTFLQDPHYRNGVAHLSMGYSQPPLPGFYLGPEGVLPAWSKSVADSQRNEGQITTDHADDSDKADRFR